MEKIERKVYAIKDTCLNQFLQHLAPNGVPCWSTCWTYIFDSREEAKQAKKRIERTTGLSCYKIIPIHYKEKSEPTKITYTT